MDVNAAYTIWLREMKRLSREKPRLIGNLATPFIWLAIMGVGLASSVVLPGGKENYLTFVVPGVMGMTILFTSIFAGISVIFDKQFGFLKEMLVAPIPRSSIVAGKIAGSASVAIANGTIIMLVAILFGVALPNVSIFTFLSAVVLMALTSMFFVSLGLAIAAKLDSMEGFQVIMSLLVMPVFLVSGSFFPLENVPDWMKSLALIDPLRYCIDGLRAALIGQSQFPLFVDAGVLLLMSGIMWIISTILFEGMSI